MAGMNRVSNGVKSESTFMNSFIESLESRTLLSASISPATLVDFPVKPVFVDDFSSDSAVNSSLWSEPTYDPNGSTYLGRTQLRVAGSEPPLKIRNGSVSLIDDSYNPTNQSGQLSFYGSELVSNRSFRIDTGKWDGLMFSFTAEIQPTSTMPNVVGGEVGAGFLYGLLPDGNRDEIDNELLTNQIASGSNQSQSNVFVDAPFTSTGVPQFNSIPSGGTLAEYHTYTTVCYSNKIEFFTDGTLTQTYTGPVPMSAMQMMLDLWTPDDTWPAAYSSEIQPTADPSANQRLRMQVSDVEIDRIEQPITSPVVGTPGIQITNTSGGFASGTVSGVNPANYAVAVYIKVNGGWWTKPYWDQPLSAIQSTGAWSAGIITGGDDADATEVRAYLVPSSTDVPLAYGGGLDPSLNSYPFSDVLIG
jgi:hypothetical protein